MNILSVKIWISVGFNSLYVFKLLDPIHAQEQKNGITTETEKSKTGKGTHPPLELMGRDVIFFSGNCPCFMI